MAGRKKTGKEFTDELERVVDHYHGELPGAFSEGHLALHAACIRDLAIAFIIEQARRGVWKSSAAAWHNVEKAQQLIKEMCGSESGKSNFKDGKIEGLNPEAIADFIKRATPKEE